MRNTIEKTDLNLNNLVFPEEAKMCLGFMSFRALPAELKQKTEHNSANIQPIITYFHGRFNFMKRHIFLK